MPEISGLTVLTPRGHRPPGAVMEADPLRLRLQRLTSEIAAEETRWDDAARREVTEIFDERAESWSTRKSSAYLFPLVDALRRGDVARGGRCLEVGAATGLQAATLAGHFDELISLDISMAMLTLHPPSCGSRVVADGAKLPVGQSALDAIVCVNAFVFPREYLRVLSPNGVIIQVATRGDRTPIYLDSKEILAALRRVDPRFQARTSLAAEGCWTVARRELP